MSEGVCEAYYIKNWGEMPDFIRNTDRGVLNGKWHNNITASSEKRLWNMVMRKELKIAYKDINGFGLVVGFDRV